MTEEDRRARATEGFFGRRRGKPLRQAQSEALADTLPRLGLDLSTPAPDNPRSLFEAAVDEVRIEIGFGGGERLLPAVRAHRTTGFIGVEPFVNGMAKLVASIADDQPDNLRLHDDDAIQLLDWLPARSISAIDLFYPDPWPKRRHWKRRFVNPGNLERFARVLQPGGTFRFASDIDHYVDWTLLAFARHPAFEWTARTADDWRLPYVEWTRTRYEAKAVREGRRSAYLTFIRN